LADRKQNLVMNSQSWKYTTNSTERFN